MSNRQRKLPQKWKGITNIPEDTDTTSVVYHLPLSSIERNAPEYQKFIKTVPKEKEVWFYCRSGRRSGIASEKVNSLGGFRVRNIGGFTDLKAAGLPIKFPRR